MANKRVRLQLEVPFASLEAKSNFERRLEAARLLLTPPGHKLDTYGLLDRLLECLEKSTEPGRRSEAPARLSGSFLASEGNFNFNTCAMYMLLSVLICRCIHWRQRYC